MALIKKDSPAEKEVKTEDIASENAIQEKVETQKATITLTPEELKALIQEEVRKAQPIVEEQKTAVILPCLTAEPSKLRTTIVSLTR